VTPRKVVFLDIDGVMNHVRTRAGPGGGLRAMLEPASVALLNRVVEATGAVVVVSSSWRLVLSLDALRAAFAAAGCVAEIVDVTPALDASRRELEIAAWLAAQAEPPARFVILDDEYAMDALPGRLVRTSKLRGLCADDLPAVLERLAD
jgi:hypothetical protein